MAPGNKSRLGEWEYWGADQLKQRSSLKKPAKALVAAVGLEPTT